MFEPHQKSRWRPPEPGSHYILLASAQPTCRNLIFTGTVVLKCTLGSLWGTGVCHVCVSNDNDGGWWGLLFLTPPSLPFGPGRLNPESRRGIRGHSTIPTSHNRHQILAHTSKIMYISSLAYDGCRNIIIWWVIMIFYTIRWCWKHASM